MGKAGQDTIVRDLWLAEMRANEWSAENFIIYLKIIIYLFYLFICLLSSFWSPTVCWHVLDAVHVSVVHGLLSLQSAAAVHSTHWPPKHLPLKHSASEPQPASIGLRSLHTGLSGSVVSQNWVAVLHPSPDARHACREGGHSAAILLQSRR